MSGKGTELARRNAMRMILLQLLLLYYSTRSTALRRCFANCISGCRGQSHLRPDEILLSLQCRPKGWLYNETYIIWLADPLYSSAASTKTSTYFHWFEFSNDNHLLYLLFIYIFRYVCVWTCLQYASPMAVIQYRKRFPSYTQLYKYLQ